MFPNIFISSDSPVIAMTLILYLSQGFHADKHGKYQHKYKEPLHTHCYSPIIIIDSKYQNFQMIKLCSQSTIMINCRHTLHSSMTA